MKLVAIGLCAMLLVGCTNRQATTSATAEIPRYTGQITLVDQPVSFSMNSLDRRATLFMQKNTTTNDRGRAQRVEQNLAGYIDSNNIGGKVQVNYVIDRMNVGSGLQTVPTIILQFTYSRNAELERAEFGGAMLAQAKPEERAALNAAGEILLKAFRRFHIGGEKTYRQGDVVRSFRLKDYLDDLEQVIPLKGIVSTGSGYTYRLVGQTIRNGRLNYVLVIDGSEQFGSQDGNVICTISGYSLVDAQTGLFSETHSLIAVDGEQRGSKMQIREFSKDTINF